MELNLQKRMGGLKTKIPDIQKTLDSVRFLKLKKVGPFSVAVLSTNVALVKEMVARGADLTARYSPTDHFADPVKPISLPRQNQTIMHIAAGVQSHFAQFCAVQSRLCLDGFLLS